MNDGFDSYAPWTAARAAGLVAGLVVCLVVGWPRTGSAEDSDRKPSVEALSNERRETFLEFLEAGNEAYRAGNYEKALPFYQKALDIAVEPLIHYRMAICYERSGRPRQALEQYRTFLERKPDAEKRGKVETTIETLENELRAKGRATLRVRSSPPGARAVVRAAEQESSSDRSRGETPLTVDVSPGTLRIRVEKDGYRPVRETIDVEGGETYNVNYLLEPDPRRRGGPRQASSSKTIAIVATITGGAGALVGGTLYAISLHCGLNRKSCSRSLFNTAAYGSYVGGGLGIVGLGTAAVFGILQPTRFPSDDSSRALRLRLAPRFVGISGRF